MPASKNIDTSIGFLLNLLLKSLKPRQSEICGKEPVRVWAGVACRGGDNLGHLGAGSQAAGVYPALGADDGGGLLLRAARLPLATSRKPALDWVEKKCTESCAELSEKEWDCLL